MLVFGPNQFWSKFGFDLEFLNSAGPTSLPPIFLLCCALLLLLLAAAATCHPVASPPRTRVPPNGKRSVAVTSPPPRVVPVLHHATIASHRWPLLHACPWPLE
jgi:hypothetical protein